MRIYLDDERDPPRFGRDGFPFQWDVICRQAESAIILIKSGLVTHISFDHDLGEGTKTGYDVAKQIEELASKNKIPPIDYYIHSGNVVGSKNIDKAMKSAWQFWETNIQKNG